MSGEAGATFRFFSLPRGVRASRFLESWLPWVLLSCVAPAQSLAGAANGEVGPLAYRVLAPDWSRQGEAVSVLLVLEGLSTDSGPPVGESRRVAARLELPAGAFDGEATREVVLVVRAGETRRFAFKDLRPRVGVPAAVHRLRLVLRFLGAGEGPGSGAPSPFAAVRLELKVVRGSVVPRGMWSVLVPVIISLLSLPAFGLFLRRHSRTGWWRTTGEPLADSLEEPSGGAWWRSER